MAERKFVVNGRVIDRATRGGVAGLRVEAWDKDLFYDDLLGSALTDARGDFRIEFDESYFQELFSEGRADLYFKVFDGDELIASTGDAVRWGAGAGEASVTIEIDAPTERPPQQGEPAPPTDAAAKVTERQLAAQLLDARTGEPLAGLHVEALTAGDGAGEESVGYDITNDKGQFAIVYAVPEAKGSVTPSATKLQLRVLGPRAEEVFSTELNLGAYRGEMLAIRVPSPPTAEPPSPSLSQIADSVKGGLPPELASYLEQRGVTSLKDVRESGGVGQLEGLPVPAEHPAVRAIDAHAALSVLSTDVQLNASLIESGYTSIFDIAGAPRATFFDATRERLGDFKSAQLQEAARAQTMFLDNVSAGLWADVSNGHAAGANIVRAFSPRCGCEDCQAAVSPLAYLADLLEYAVRHLRNGPNFITLSSLTDTFHQPFGDLPASCQQMDEQVRQVRLCVEVLRRYLAANPPASAQRAALERAERQYRAGVYATLLGRLGTSYEELRLARTANSEARKALAERLGFALGPSRPDRLDSLLLDPAAVASRPEALTERALERLFGLVESTRDPLTPGPTPELQTWRVEHLHTLWEGQGRPPDPYHGDFRVIDPDLIGPDDFRHPFVKARAADPDGPFDVWVRRRDWVDERLRALSSIPPRTVRGQQVPDLDAILNSMYEPVGYGTERVMPWAASARPAEFDTLQERLNEGDAGARDRIRADLGLTPDAFTRLSEIRAAYREAVADARSPSVSDEEWREVFSVLVRAQKERLARAWRDEESALGFSLGPEHFWFSLREPKEGEQPPALPARRPLIDPDTQKLEELVEPTAGAVAAALWRARRAELGRVNGELRAARESGGFGMMLRRALGHPNPGDDLQHDLAAVREQLGSADEALAARARTVVNDDLHLSVEAFDRLMTIKARDDDSRPTARRPTAAEWAEVYAILTTAYKEKHAFPVWMAEERGTTPPLIYWRALKARLPRWRVSVESRRTWQQSLSARGSAPVIDPDLIAPADFKTPSPADDAFRLWEARRAWVNAEFDGLRRTREAAASALDGLDEIVQRVLGVRATDLSALGEEQAAGNGILPRLEQLGLTTEAFSYLLCLRRTLEGGAALLDTEWEQAYSILLQVRKRRAFAAWREEEEAHGIVVGPRQFRVPPAPREFPPPPPTPLPAWRATQSERRAWQETLQTRIEQERGVGEALRAAVGDAEEAGLPSLRNALVMAVGAPGGGLDAKAKWVTDHLLIDAEAGGCQKTTRIAQAIETAQGILFSVRTAQLNDTYPDLELDAEHFDEEWKWVGSYATWRAAMFVFLYPENIIMPALRRRQTPAFREVVDDLRSNRRLTPEQACEAAARYSSYFEDVCKLSVDASCQARTRLTDGDGCRGAAERGYRCLLYLFARGGATGTIYWSAYDPQDDTGHAQTNWGAVPGLQGTTEVLGAVPYRAGTERRFVFLFARVQGDGEEKLVFTKYDLERRGWDQEVTELELPEGAKAFSAVVEQQDSAARPPHLAIRVPNGNVYDGWLNGDGSGWSHANDWHVLVDRSKGFYLQPLALTQAGQNGFHLFARNVASGNFEFRLFGGPGGPDIDPRWRVLGRGEWHGAYAWPLIDRVYAFWSEGTQMRYRMIASDTEGLPFDDVATVGGFDAWLSSVFGLSLSRVPLTILPLSILFAPLSINVPGMSLLDYLTLDAGNPLRRQIGEPSYGALGRLFIDSFGRQIPTLAGWREADRVVRDNSREGLSVAAALRRLFEGGRVQLRRLADGEVPQLVPGLSGLRRVAVHSDDSSKNTKMMAYERASGQAGCWRANVSVDPSNLRLTFGTPSRIAPLVTGPFGLSERMSENDLQLRRGLVRAAFEANGGETSNLIYLEEAYYFMPVHLALQLQSRGQYTAALDWYRTVYDYSMPPGRRKIYHGLVLEESASVTYERALNWLGDPLNPHEIAATRQNAYTRFTLLSLVRCLLEFADAEFTRDTAESVPRARTLYMTALELLDLPELRQRLGACEELIGTLDIEVGDPEWSLVWDEIRGDLTGITEPTELESTVGLLGELLAGDGGWAERLHEANKLVAMARDGSPPTFSDIVSSRRAVASRAHTALLGSPTIGKVVEQVGAAAGRDFLGGVALISGVVPAALNANASIEMPWLGGQSANGGGAVNVARVSNDAAAEQDYHQELRSFAPLAPTRSATLAQVAGAEPTAALNVARRFSGGYVPAPSFHFCVPPNPVVRGLRMGAELNLYKLRNCYNIAGMKRELEPFTAPTDTGSGLPTIGGRGHLVLPGAVTLQPTLYRFPVLIERAKQLAGHAQQIEAAMFSALEKRDAELYSLLRAHQDVRLSRAGVRLQELRVREAEGGVRLAELQRDRSALQEEHYQRLLNEELSVLEILAFAFQVAAVVHFHVAAAIKQAVTFGVGGIGDVGTALGATSSLFQMQAGFERRRQEWEFERAVARQDVQIGVQQVQLAQDHVRVVGQEREIALMQTEHAEAVADFIANKFSNVELYDWMSEVLERVYDFFLRQTTSVARLAVAQLAFERQEVPPPFIQDDYWNLPAGGAAGDAAESRGADRRGLTGSARLLQDIYRLDQYAFETDRRKLQLTKTISLARLTPAELQRFRETGVLNFATPMSMFDRDFPGHYLRLVKRIRTSVLAFIPPTEGIKATLSTTGTSRVVIGGDLFQTVVVRREPEAVALSSPRDATGLFELNPQPEMLMPFEGMGVDAVWEFRMPRASNLFDYRTIADVLVTIEYTALDNFAYRHQVVQQLDRTVYAERPFSFRHQFADPWYDLHNPDQTASPMVVRFATRDDDFPPNLENLRISHVSLYFARAANRTFEVPVTGLRFTERGGAPVGGGATSVDGVVSTRRGNAPAWAPFTGKSPVGEWELSLPNTQEMRDRFRNEEIEDILFVVTYSGDAPEWPA